MYISLFCADNSYRVMLRPGPLPGSDYINASFVNVIISSIQISWRCICTCIFFLQGYKQKGAYIATQCPLQNTVTDFWRMVSEFQCGCIVMLCELEEDGQVSLYIISSSLCSKCMYAMLDT